MVRTRSWTISLGHQDSGDASRNPHWDRQLAPVTQLSSVQHIQSMVAAMTKLTRQNQELSREINLRRQRHEGYVEGQAQSQEDRGNPEPETQSKGTTSWRVLHLEKEMDQMRNVMDGMRENMRRANPVEDLVHRIDSLFMASINGHPFHQSSRCFPWIRMMEHVILSIILLLSRLQCTFKGFQTRLCVEPSQPPSKDQHKCGSVWSLLT